MMDWRSPVVCRRDDSAARAVKRQVQKKKNLKVNRRTHRICGFNPDFTKQQQRIRKMAGAQMSGVSPPGAAYLPETYVETYGRRQTAELALERQRRFAYDST
jgi:hypothetical protein